MRLCLQHQIATASPMQSPVIGVTMPASWEGSGQGSKAPGLCYIQKLDVQGQPGSSPY